MTKQESLRNVSGRESLLASGRGSPSSKLLEEEKASPLEKAELKEGEIQNNEENPDKDNILSLNQVQDQELELKPEDGNNLEKISDALMHETEVQATNHSEKSNYSFEFIVLDKHIVESVSRSKLVANY